MKKPTEEPGLPKRLYSIPEAATYLGCTVLAVRTFIWGRRLPAVRLGRRKLWLDLRDLDRFIEESKSYVT